MRLAFAGTPEFAALALRALVAAGHEVALVLTQPDRPAGRGLKLQASAVKEYALEAGLPLIQPRGLRLDGRWADEAQAAQAALLAARPQALVVAAYGLILPRWTLDIAPHGSLNIHASLLPRWRGAAPIHRAIEAGDPVTGVTIMQMDDGLDTGPMLMAQSLPILGNDTTGSLHDRLAALGASLIVQALDAAQAGTLTAQAQPEQGITYASKIDKAEAAIDWALPAEVIDRRIRAFDPFPGAALRAGAEVVKVWAARPVRDGHPGAGTPPGTILAVEPDGVRVACGAGALDLLVLQRPSGRRLPAAIVATALGWRAGIALGEASAG